MKKATILILLVAFLASCVRYSPMQQAWTPKSHKKMSTRTPSAYKK